MHKILEKGQIFILLLLPVIVGLYIRFDDLKIWHEYPSRYYYNQRPLFTGYDAFFFGRWAQEYKKGVYKAGKRDPLRFVPDNYLSSNIKYPSPIPLLSFLGAKLSSSKPLEQVALWLPPVCSVLFVIPLVLFFVEIGCPLAGFAGALLGSVGLIYVVRTSIVRYDTDMLNLFFPFAISFLLLLAAKAKNRWKFLYLISAGLFCQLYNWWYDHPGLILGLLFTFFLYLLIDSHFDFKKIYIDLLLVLLFANPLIIKKGIWNFIGLFNTYLIKSSEVSWGGFPNILMSISEAQHFSLPQIANISSGNLIVFLGGFLGLLFFIFKKPKEFLFLIIPFFIGLLTLKKGNRFAMYLSPFIGIGIGFIFDWLCLSLKKIPLVYSKTIAIIFLSVLILLTNKSTYKYVASPKVSPALAYGFSLLEDITPPNSWIWTWWDYGTAIEYFAHRAVFHDPQSQYSPKTYFVATSFSAKDPQRAHNVILGIAHLGLTGIKEQIKKGVSPAQIAQEIFEGRYTKPSKNPVYWVFTMDMIGKIGWINYFGTWNFSQQKGLRENIFVFKGCRPTPQGLLVCSNVRIDPNHGLLYTNRFQAMPVEYVCVKKGKDVILKRFNMHNNYVLEIIEDHGHLSIFLMKKDLYDSMFNKMYILRTYDSEYFKLIYDYFPVMVVYKVKGTGQNPSKN